MLTDNVSKIMKNVLPSIINVVLGNGMIFVIASFLRSKNNVNFTKNTFL